MTTTTQLVPDIYGFQKTVTANVRSFYTTPRIAHNFDIVSARCAYPPNAQRLLKVRFWVVAYSTLADDSQPIGIPLITNVGDDFIVGDDNNFEFRIGRRNMPGGMYIMVDAENTDASATHTLDCAVTVLEKFDG